MADKYILRVTAGTTYNPADHTEVPVNTAKPVKITGLLMDIDLNVRVKNYRGLPRKSPSTSPYFELEPHAKNNDQYSIAFRFTPKKPSKPSKPSLEPQSLEPQADDEASGDEEPEGISALDLHFGNDFDRPIRDRLPPGFSYAMKIVKWWIDPGLDGDPYADNPYLYGPALSSFNLVHVGSGNFDESKGGLCITEGGDEDGMAAREEIGAPADGKQRQSWALKQDNKEAWIWEYDQTYAVDFFNSYLDFGEFALRLPGYSMPIMKYWDGQGLRYVLRNRTTKDVYLVVLFTLHLKEDVNEDGTLKPEVTQAYTAQGMATENGEFTADDDDEFDGQAALEEASRQFSNASLSQQVVTADDDVD